MSYEQKTISELASGPVQEYRVSEMRQLDSTRIYLSIRRGDGQTVGFHVPVRKEALVQELAKEFREIASELELLATRKLT